MLERGLEGCVEIVRRVCVRQRDYREERKDFWEFVGELDHVSPPCTTYSGEYTMYSRKILI
jgi:hypothetical protein